MMLSLVCDQECFDVDQLTRALGLARDDVLLSVGRLSAAALLCPDQEMPHLGLDRRVCASKSGKKLADRILQTITGDDE